jgi:hypothetical protein
MAPQIIQLSLLCISLHFSGIDECPDNLVYINIGFLDLQDRLAPS